MLTPFVLLTEFEKIEFQNAHLCSDVVFVGMYLFRFSTCNLYILCTYDHFFYNQVSFYKLNKLGKITVSLLHIIHEGNITFNKWINDNCRLVIDLDSFYWSFSAIFWWSFWTLAENHANIWKYYDFQAKFDNNNRWSNLSRNWHHLTFFYYWFF